MQKRNSEISEIARTISTISVYDHNSYILYYNIICITLLYKSFALPIFFSRF